MHLRGLGCAPHVVATITLIHSHNVEEKVVPTQRSNPYITEPSIHQFRAQVDPKAVGGYESAPFLENAAFKPNSATFPGNPSALPGILPDEEDRRPEAPPEAP